MAKTHIIFVRVFQFIASSVDKKVKVYDCCPESYTHIEVTISFQRKYIVSNEGIVRNPRLIQLPSSIEEPSSDEDSSSSEEDEDDSDDEKNWTAWVNLYMLPKIDKMHITS